MRFPATLGCVSLPVVVGAPRHSWLRALGAVPRHSWLGSAGGGGVWSLATPGCGSRLRFPATSGWGGPLVVEVEEVDSGLAGGGPGLWRLVPSALAPSGRGTGARGLFAWWWALG